MKNTSNHLLWIHRIHSYIASSFLPSLALLHRSLLRLRVICVCVCRFGPERAHMYIYCNGRIHLPAKCLTPLFPFVMHLHNVLFVVCSRKFNLLCWMRVRPLAPFCMWWKTKEWNGKNVPDRKRLHAMLVLQNEIERVRVSECLFVYSELWWSFFRIVKMKRAHSL